MNIDIKNLSKEQIEDLKKQLSEYKEEQPIEWTRDGMYIGDDDNKDHYCIEGDFSIDNYNNLTNKGLSFQTREQAEDFRDKLQALKTIKKWHALNDNFEPDWSNEIQEKYIVSYNYSIKELDYSFRYVIKSNSFLPYYSSVEKVEKAIKELEKEYKIIFDVI